MADITFLCDDDPEANGALPETGACRYVLIFPLEDGRILEVCMGQKGFDTVRHCINTMQEETAMERLIHTVESYHAKN